jgi:peptidoglycan/xylan/chitin deacetylase (PgdA/CDA1 family)
MNKKILLFFTLFLLTISGNVFAAATCGTATSCYWADNSHILDSAMGISHGPNTAYKSMCVGGVNSSPTVVYNFNQGGQIIPVGYRWYCGQISNGTGGVTPIEATCFAPQASPAGASQTSTCTTTLAIINGQCGSANGQSFTSAPTTNLCSSGTSSSITGSGPWYWTCSGSNGGTKASCLATKKVADTTRPTVSITNPKTGNTVSNTINLIATATDNVGVVGVQFMVDGANVGTEDTTSPYQISFDTKTLSNGAHTVSAKARDAAGNTKTSTAISVTVTNADTTAPSVSITSPVANSTVSNIINLTANASDNIGVIGVQFLIDNVNFGSEDTTAPYEASLDTKTLSNGAHTVSAKARDAAGNITTSITVSITVANSIPQPEDNLIQNPFLENSDASNNPIGWQTGNWGTNTAVFTYPATGYDNSKAAKVELTQYTDGDAKWYFNDVSVLPNQEYKFSDSYQSNVQSTLTVRFTLSDSTFQYVDIGSLEASTTWIGAEKTFTTPANAVSVTIFHLINSVGYLTVDNFYLNKTIPANQLAQGMVSLNFDDGWLSTYNNALPILNTAGLKSTNYIITSALEYTDEYIDASQVLALQSAGHEIGAHSKTHPDLTKLSSAQLQDEVNGSKQDLLAIGVNQVLTFAYPYGEVNDSVVTATKNAGYIGARGVQPEFNTKETDPYLLESQSVEVNTTIDTIKSWIDTAVQNKTWVILVFHQVDHNGDQYSTTPETFQQIVDYLILKNVPVVTNASGLQILSQ